MATALDVALEYGELGWHLLPGSAKKPFVKWSEATCEKNGIIKFWERWPEAEILVLCGPSKLAVLDVDSYKQPGYDFAHVPYSSWEMKTPRGGLQLLFSDPDSTVPSTAGKIHPIIDTRGVGGLIVVPSPNSPNRKWVRRSGQIPTWPATAFPDLGKPKVPLAPVTDEEGREWVPIQEERLPNESCPGAAHVNGDRVPSLGIKRLPTGIIQARCFAGCDKAETDLLLVEAGRYTREELGLVGQVVRLDSRFIDRGALMALESPTWMIEPFIQENALVMLAAKFNTGKTFVAVNWAAELSQTKKVLYVALEGLFGLKKRINAWEEHYERSCGNLLYSPPGYSLNLLSDRAVEGFLADLEAEGGFDLVVIDNLGEAMPGDENDSETVARSMHALNQIRHSSGGAVLDLHNSGHGGQVRARGHSKMLDVHDTVVYLEAIEGSINGLKVISGKERNAERFVTRRAQLKSVGNSLVAVMGGQAVAESNPVYRAIKLGHNTANKVALHLNIPYTTAVDRVKELLEAGDLTVLKIGKENTYHCAWDQAVS